MKTIYFNNAQNYEPQKDWKRTSLCIQKAISIEYFIKPPHHASPSHSHPNAQVLVVLKGKMSVKTPQEEVVLSEYDTVFIEPNETHVITNLLDETSTGLDIFIPGRDFDFWLNNLRK